MSCSTIVRLPGTSRTITGTPSVMASMSALLTPSERELFTTTSLSCIARCRSVCSTAWWYSTPGSSVTRFFRPAAYSSLSVGPTIARKGTGTAAMPLRLADPLPCSSRALVMSQCQLLTSSARNKASFTGRRPQGRSSRSAEEGTPSCCLKDQAPSACLRGSCSTGTGGTAGGLTEGRIVWARRGSAPRRSTAMALMYGAKATVAAAPFTASNMTLSFSASLECSLTSVPP
mmetsp:Transcript_13117/g.52321  ORF Transcript_13117/g.52321 Transcript_13117/m.52321 type:complete len:231 (+) Transcript_13117:243-935(+)